MGKCRGGLVMLLMLGLATPALAVDREAQAEACVMEMQDETRRAELEQRPDFVAEAEHAEAWNQRVYERLPEKLSDSPHPHDRLLLRWLLWARETRASGLAEDPMAAASVDHSASLAVLDALVQSGSDDPLVLAATTIACPAPGEDIQPGAYCGEELDRRFQAADPDNAYPWLQAAQRAWAADDLDTAYEHLRKAAKAKRMDWYFGRSQQVVADRLRHHFPDENLDPDELALMAQTLGPQIVGYPGFLGLSQLCGAETVAGDDARIEACVGAVEVLAGPGASLMDVQVAAGVAQVLAPALNSRAQSGLEEWAQLRTRQVQDLQTRLAGIGCLSIKQGPDAYQALYGKDYLERVVEKGEFQAQQELVSAWSEARDSGD